MIRFTEIDKRFLNKRILTILTVCVFCLVVFLRLYHIQMDPPQNLKWGPGYYEDEGWWAHNARNWVKFDDFVVDGFNQSFYVYPVYTVSLGIFFELVGGDSLSALRIFNALTGILTISLLVWFFRRQKKMQFLVCLFLGMNYYYLFYNRLGFLENLMILFIVFGTVVLMIESLNKYLKLFLSSLFLTLAIWTKLLAVFSLILPFFFIVTYEKNIKKIAYEVIYTFSLLLVFSSSFLLFVGFDGFIFYFHKLSEASVSITDFKLFFNNFSIRNSLYFWFPNILMLAFAVSGVLQIVDEKNKKYYIVIAWFVLNVLFSFTFLYQPQRYLLSNIIPMSILASYSIVRGSSKTQRIHLPLILFLPCYILYFVITETGLSAQYGLMTMLKYGIALGIGGILFYKIFPKKKLLNFLVPLSLILTLSGDIYMASKAFKHSTFRDKNITANLLKLCEAGRSIDGNGDVCKWILATNIRTMNVNYWQYPEYTFPDSYPNYLIFTSEKPRAGYKLVEDIGRRVENQGNTKIYLFKRTNTHDKN